LTGGWRISKRRYAMPPAAAFDWRGCSPPRGQVERSGTARGLHFGHPCPRFSWVFRSIPIRFGSTFRARSKLSISTRQPYRTTGKSHAYPATLRETVASALPCAGFAAARGRRTEVRRRLKSAHKTGLRAAQSDLAPGWMLGPRPAGTFPTAPVSTPLRGFEFPVSVRSGEPRGCHWLLRSWN